MHYLKWLIVLTKRDCWFCIGRKDGSLIRRYWRWNRESFRSRRRERSINMLEEQRMPPFFKIDLLFPVFQNISCWYLLSKCRFKINRKSPTDPTRLPSSSYIIISFCSMISFTEWLRLKVQMQHFLTCKSMCIMVWKMQSMQGLRLSKPLPLPLSAPISSRETALDFDSSMVFSSCIGTIIW